MTDEQIIMALRCCNGDGSCSECPYSGIHDCVGACTADVINLINHQKTQIAELQQFDVRKTEQFIDGLMDYAAERIAKVLKVSDTQ